MLARGKKSDHPKGEEGGKWFGEPKEKKQNVTSLLKGGGKKDQGKKGRVKTKGRGGEPGWGNDKKSREELGDQRRQSVFKIKY